MQNLGYVVVTDYVAANTGADLSDALQELILAHPNRTIFFPDGEYVIGKPIATPANPIHSVMLVLSNFAVIKAADGWSDGEAMIRLGAAEPFNTILTNGSNYGITGGVIDGNGVANGISIDSGRETRIENVSIKHTQIGIHIKDGANSHSSDADILNVNIVGNKRIGSIGVLVEGCDNTFTNMRIAYVQIGVKLLRSGQMLRNIHPLFGFGNEMTDENYQDSYAFWDDGHCHNWYDYCYSDQYANGFRMRSGARMVYNDCFCYWYTDRGGMQNGFVAEGKFCSVIRGTNVTFHKNSTNNAYLRVGEAGGNGAIEFPIFPADRIMDQTYRDYMRGEAIT